MRKSPITVQEWLDTLPSSRPTNENSNHMHVMQSQPKPSLRLLGRDASIQSDDCSHCSSVESVLELRKPDPEAVLLGLGFGPPTNAQHVARIPTRFLQPSKLLTKIDINKFLEEQGEQQQVTDFDFNTSSNPSSPARATKCATKPYN